MEKVSSEHLQESGFQLDIWGNPHQDPADPRCLFWSRSEDLRLGMARYYLIFWYFPEAFEGYVPHFSDRSEKPSGYLMCQADPPNLPDMDFPIQDPADLALAQEAFRQMIRDRHAAAGKR